mmetsp:Transcript_36919/g.79893  ORF Transcript_36919/g.79893 Transcript_36919/m.79893 type:complete len:226 (-) Transcript_36919:405-1082(-)
MHIVELVCVVIVVRFPDGGRPRLQLSHPLRQHPVLVAQSVQFRLRLQKRCAAVVVWVGELPALVGAGDRSHSRLELVDVTRHLPRCLHHDELRLVELLHGGSGVDGSGVGARFDRVASQERGGGGGQSGLGAASRPTHARHLCLCATGVEVVDHLAQCTTLLHLVFGTRLVELSLLLRLSSRVRFRRKLLLQKLYVPLRLLSRQPLLLERVQVLLHLAEACGLLR